METERERERETKNYIYIHVYFQNWQIHSKGSIISNESRTTVWVFHPCLSMIIYHFKARMLPIRRSQEEAFHDGIFFPFHFPSTLVDNDIMLKELVPKILALTKGFSTCLNEAWRGKPVGCSYLSINQAISNGSGEGWDSKWLLLVDSHILQQIGEIIDKLLLMGFEIL